MRTLPLRALQVPSSGLSKSKLQVCCGLAVNTQLGPPNLAPWQNSAEPAYLRVSGQRLLESDACNPSGASLRVVRAKRGFVAPVRAD